MDAPNDNSTTPWWNLTVSGENLEERSHILFDAGILGLEVESPNCARCYFTGNDQALRYLKAEIAQAGFVVTEANPIPQTNWCARCAELWEPLAAGKLKIIPVADEADVPKELNQSKGSIYIVPGMGFGTGHHDSTRMALELLQNSKLSTVEIQSVLDLGTGSGILAIACALLFSESLMAPVLATDIDLDALENARINVKINGYQNSITVEQAELARIDRSFNLIVANIYAEVLCNLQSLFCEKLTSAGFLLLSGIMTERLPLIEQAFSQSHWKIIEKRATTQWKSLLLEKR